MGDMMVLWQYLKEEIRIVPLDGIYDAFFWVLLGGSAFRQRRDFRDSKALGWKQFLGYSGLFWTPLRCCISPCQSCPKSGHLMVTVVISATLFGGVCRCQVAHCFPFVISEYFVRGTWNLCKYLVLLKFSIYLLVYIIMVSWFNGS